MKPIAIVIRDLPYLKLLHPICEQLSAKKVQYNIYYWDVPRHDKEYNRASLENLNISSPSIVSNANKLVKFKTDKQLLSYLVRDKIDKMVSVEIWLWAKNYIKWFRSNKIQTHSVLYLTDSIWQPKGSVVSIDNIYYSAKYPMKMHHKFIGEKFNPDRDYCFGSPLFDSLDSCTINGSKNILVLLPNLRPEHVKGAFGNSGRFIKIIDKISKHGNIIFKTRKKQWLPSEIKKYAKKIVNDGHIMYPSQMQNLFSKCDMTVMFHSSGVYETVMGNNYVCNIALPLNRWGWEQDKLRAYFDTSKGSLYQFEGVTETLSQEEFLSDYNFEIKVINKQRREEWIKEFVGATLNSSEKIAENIINK